MDCISHFIVTWMCSCLEMYMYPSVVVEFIVINGKYFHLVIFNVTIQMALVLNPSFVWYCSL